MPKGLGPPNPSTPSFQSWVKLALVRPPLSVDNFSGRLVLVFPSNDMVRGIVWESCGNRDIEFWEDEQEKLGKAATERKKQSRLRLYLDKF